MLKDAFNALTRLHSRSGQLKRLGTPEIYSPCRLTPSNFFRFLRGPEYTTVKGVEFVIPIDSLLGQFSQTVSFDEVPDDGDFKLKFGSNTTNAIAFDATASDIQTELRLFSGYNNVTVTGDFSSGFVILFAGVSVDPGLGEVVDNNLLFGVDPVVLTFSKAYVPWSDPIKKGDRIIDGSRLWTVDEIIELHDVGAQVMAFRVRAD